MNLEQYKIKLRGLVNHVEKVPTKIVWVHGNDECLSVPCYKENDYLVIELIPDCVGNACIEGYLQFEESCSDCGTVHFKRCFCNTDLDCPDCSECNPDGICQDKCVEGEFCKDNTCVECDENNPCPNNLVCINGDCKCPPNMIREGDRCVECTAQSNLGKCYECINGVITPKCGQACIELTGECVECAGFGDCADRTDGKNCCVDNQCTCCTGFEWDNELKKCVPSCNENTCNECERCTKNGCEPIKCPAGYKCWKGDCVYWPCDSTSCENGADCGPECGCVELDGVTQCIPCYLLECMGLCEQALGCKCNPNTGKCEGSDKCNQSYCDGENPCVGEDCTCYENKCVDCSNFPCSPNDCDTRPNCGCNDSGECDGKDCGGDLKLEQETSCDSSTGCKLKATIPSGACKCDPIIFKVENVNTCSTNNTTILNLKTTLYKKVNGADIPYTAYKTSPYFADNELVSTYIRATVDYEYYMDGKFYSYSNANPATLPNSGIMDNAIDNLVFNGTHIKKNLLIAGTTYKTRVTVNIYADATKVENANCINYETPLLIGKFVLDYSTSDAETATCSKINNEYKEAQVTLGTDNVSIKKPRFTWFRSNTSTFGDSEFIYDGVYAKNGWFRKAFGTLQGSTWVDEINNPQKYEVNANGELIANYNYMVKADCGCGARTNIKEKVTFCCPKDFVYTVTPCERKIVINPFSVCSVNDTLPTNYDIADEAQVKYRLKAILDNGQEVVTVITKAGITKIYDNAIVSASIVQGYSGGILSGDENCSFPLNIPSANLPEPVITVDCGSGSQFRVTVTQTSPLNISKVEVFGNDVKLSPEIFNTTPGMTALYNKELGGTGVGLGEDQIAGSRIARLRAKVTFTNGCSKTIDLTPCEPSVVALTVPPGAKSRKECSASGQGVTVETEVNGFNLNEPLIYQIAGGDLNAPISNSTGTFTNLGAGTYTITVTQGSLTQQTNISVQSSSEPQVSLTPSTLCPGESAVLTITAPVGSQFSVMGPTGSIPIPAIPAGGSYSISGITAPGGYTVTSVADNPDICHVFEWSSLLTVGGQVLNPVFSNILYGTYCVNSPIEIFIIDGVDNKTYNINSFAGYVTDQSGNTVSQMISGQTYFYTPTSVGSNAVQIISVDSNCDTLLTTPVTKNFSTITPAPVVSNITTQCVDGLYNVSATVTVASGTISSVLIGGVVATNVGSTYTVNGLPNGGNIEATSSNGCVTLELVGYTPCNCPSATLTITGPTSPLCGDQVITLSALPQLNPNIATGTWTYQWYDAGPLNCNNCTPVQVGVQGSWGTQPVELIVNANGTGSYYLVLTNDVNPECTYTSNTYTYTVETAPAEPILLVSTPTTVGTPITVQTQGGYTNYAWYINGNPVPSSNSPIYTFTPTVATTYSVMVMVNNGNSNCTASSSININVDLTCDALGTPVPASNVHSCADAHGFSILYNNNGGTFDWEITEINGSGVGNVLIGQTGTSTSSTNFQVDLTEMPAGESITTVTFLLTYDITGGSSCPILYEDVPWVYDRCSCACTSNISCDTDSYELTGSNGHGTYDIGYYQAGEPLNIILTHGGAAERFVVVYDGVTILDSTYIGTGFFSCPITEGFDYLDVTAIIDDTDITTDITGANGIVDAAITCVRKRPGAISFNYSPATEGLLQVTRNEIPCINQAGWSIEVACGTDATVCL